MLNPKNKLYRWGPVSACPLFLYFSIESAFKPLKKLFGITYSESLIIFEQDKGTWLLDDKDLGKQSTKFVKKALFDRQKRKQFFAIWNKRTKTLKDIFSELDNIDIASLPKEQLVKRYKKFAKAYNDWFVITISIELIASSIEPLLGERLKQYYQQAFATLTAPLSLTFYRQEQLDLLKIISLPKEKQKAALKKHQQKFYWIYNSYARGKVLDIAYFENELNKLKRENHKQILEEIVDYKKSIKQQKQDFIKKIKPNKDDIDLIHLVETFSELLDKRKEVNFRAEHYLEFFVQKISKLTKIPAKKLKFLLPNELGQIFDNFDADLIKEREQCFILECSDKQITHFVGKNATTISAQFNNIAEVNEAILHGIVASVGASNYFRGVAKIILTVDQMEKLKDGDILITTMTSPDFVIGMKKAGAIITDTGGMLSHAAIVSREFNKPCIVGTEIATKVIHDGDIVELHCGQGTVRIIKSKK